MPVLLLLLRNKKVSKGHTDRQGLPFESRQIRWAQFCANSSSAIAINIALLSGLGDGSLPSESTIVVGSSYTNMSFQVLFFKGNI